MPHRSQEPHRSPRTPPTRPAVGYRAAYLAGSFGVTSGTDPLRDAGLDLGPGRPEVNGSIQGCPSSSEAANCAFGHPLEDIPVGLAGLPSGLNDLWVLDLGSGWSCNNFGACTRYSKSN